MGPIYVTATSVDTSLGRREVLRLRLVRALQLFALCGFAFAQPLFDLLGDGATFFVAHNVAGSEIVLFAVALTLIPPAVLFAIIFAITLVSRPAGRWAMAVSVGALVAFTIVPPIDRSASLSTLSFVLLFLVIGTVAGVVYARLSAVRTFATYLSPAPAFFTALFLFASPVSALVTNSDPATLRRVGGQDAPVVFIMLDEFPLGALLDGNGAIDAKRFPGFSRLASVATWYPNTTTVAPWTNLAVPALLTGNLPKAVPPVAGQYPRSLFTMLGGRGNVHAIESTTRLCPRSVCGTEAATANDRSSFVKDTTIAELHRLIPRGLAERWLPAISGSWAGFGANNPASSSVATDGAKLSFSQWRDSVKEDGNRDLRSQFLGFLGSLHGPGNGRLWYLHEMLPHMPWRYLPDGRIYSTGDPYSAAVAADPTYIGPDPAGIPILRQELMLQVAYVDRQMSQLLDRLASEDLLTDSLLVVSSDHGVSLEPSGHRRAAPKLDDINRHEVLPVPLFIKHPGQTRGEVDRRRAQITDVLPTIADTLNVQLPSDWRFAGVSLLDKPTQRDRRWYNGAGAPRQVGGPIDANRMARTMLQLFGPGGGAHDLYRMGPFGGLVGGPTSSHLGPAVSGTSARLINPSLYTNVDPAAPTIPARFQARLSGIRSGTWIAVGVNGSVAGVAPAFVGRDGDEVEAVLNPASFAAGKNAISVYVIDADGPTLRPIPLS